MRLLIKRTYHTAMSSDLHADEKTLRARNLVLEELIQTEKDYVADLDMTIRVNGT